MKIFNLFVKAGSLKAVGLFIGYIVNYFIINEIGSESAGHFWTSLSYAGLISVVILFGFHTIVLRYASFDHVGILSFFFMIKRVFPTSVVLFSLIIIPSLVIAGSELLLIVFVILIRHVVFTWYKLNRSYGLALITELILSPLFLVAFLMLGVELSFAFVFAASLSLIFTGLFKHLEMPAQIKRAQQVPQDLSERLFIMINQMAKYVLDNSVYLLGFMFVSETILGSFLYSLKIFMMVSMPLVVIRAYFQAEYSRLNRAYGLQLAFDYLLKQATFCFISVCFLALAFTLLYSAVSDGALFAGFEWNPWLLVMAMSNALFGPIGVANASAGFVKQTAMLNFAIFSLLVLTFGTLIFLDLGSYFLEALVLTNVIWNFGSWLIQIKGVYNDRLCI